MNRSILFTAFSALLLLQPAVTGRLIAQDQEVNTPPELLKIIEESELTYKLQPDSEYEPEEIEVEQLLPGLFHRTPEGPVRGEVEPTPETAKMAEIAFNHFKAKEFDEAATAYLKAYDLQPEIVENLIKAGNSFYMNEEYDSARVYLERAIDQDFFNYRGYWFLSSTELKTDHPEKGLHHLTIAHVLNPGHKLLSMKLKDVRDEMDRPWDNWSFVPAIDIEDQGEEGIQVTFADGWMMYGISQAIWRYEPGYARARGIEDMEMLDLQTAPLLEGLVNFMVEQEAALQSTEDPDAEVVYEPNPDAVVLYERLQDILDGGMVQLFFYYEIIGKQYPIIFQTMDRKSVESIVEYVDKFH